MTRRSASSSATAKRGNGTARNSESLPETAWPKGTQQANILQNAADFFAEQGFAGASTAQLAARCGVSKALLFHYYASKEAILFDLLDGYTRHLLDLAAAVQARHAPGRERLRALIRAFLATYESSRARHIVLLNDVKYLEAKQRDAVLDHERALLASFADALRAAYPARVSAASAKPLAMMLFGMINWTFTWLRPRGALSYARFAEAVIGMLEQGIAGAADTLRANKNAGARKKRPGRVRPGLIR
jgi:AcrR family transcriptional regulator